jgi:hypothetical protein
MGNDHEKKKHDVHDHDKKKKNHGHEGHDGKLSEAMKNKPRSDEDETTPGDQVVSADMPTNIDSDAVAIDSLGKDPYDGLHRCIVTANVGAKDGIIKEMNAQLLMKGGDKLEFIIKEVRETATLGWVQCSPEQYERDSNKRVIFNPS